MMAGGNSLAKVNLLLALAVVWLGRHDGRYVIGVVWVCWRCELNKKRGGGFCRRWSVSARCVWATLIRMGWGGVVMGGGGGCGDGCWSCCGRS
jgi:hypothetical protein